MKNLIHKSMVRHFSVLLSVFMIIIVFALSSSLAQKQPTSTEAENPNAVEASHNPTASADSSDFPENLTERIDLGPLLRYLDERDRNRSSSLLSPSSNDQLILHLYSVIALFGFPVLIVGIVGFNNYRQRKLVLSTVEKMVEKGIQIPLELLQENKKNRSSDLKKGVIWLATGLGILAVILSTEKEQWSLSLIPIFVGIGYLIVWKLERRESSQSRLSFEESDIT